jgi:hypothetical protein
LNIKEIILYWFLICLLPHTHKFHVAMIHYEWMLFSPHFFVTASLIYWCAWTTAKLANKPLSWVRMCFLRS